MVGDSEFKTPMPMNAVYAGGYIRYIKSKQETKGVFMDCLDGSDRLVLRRGETLSFSPVLSQNAGRKEQGW